MAFTGFLVRRTAGTQSITTSTLTTLTYDTEIYDTDSFIVPGTATFTVPAGLNGKHMVFSAGTRTAATETGAVYVYRDAAAIAQASFSLSDGMVVTTGAVLLTTGEVYKAQIFTDTNASMAADARNFFSGHVVDPA